MPAGRPITCTPEMIEKAYEYIGGAWNHGTDVIPSHIGLAKFLGINRKTLYEWAKEEDKSDIRSKLSDILAECKEEQENELLHNGLNGKFNSNICKLVMGKHGYSEKQERENTGQLNITVSKDDVDTC